MCKIYKRFDNVKEFSEYLQKGKTQENFKYCECSKTGRASFTGTQSFEEANDLMLYGDKELMKKMYDAGIYETAIQIKKYVTHKTIRSTVVGAIPNVPAYLAGAPNAMCMYAQQKRKQTVINIGYNSAVFGGVKAEQIISAGAKLVSALMILEAKGIKANVYCLDLDTERNEYVSYAIKIKSSGQKFDVLRMAYFLAHPSMNRRHKFRFTEVTEGVTRPFVGGYGRPESDDNKILKHFAACKLNLDAAFCYESLSSYSVEDIINKICGNGKK